MATGSLHQSGTRLRARISDGGEGARKFDGWYDTKLKTPCTFRLSVDGVRRCVPMADVVYSEPEYADPACTTPVLSWVDPKKEAPYFAADVGAADQATACGADLATLASVSRGAPVASWHIGAEQPAPPALYFRNGGGCTRRLDMIPAVVHSVEKVAPSELVAVTAIHVEPRGASLAVQVFDNEDGSSMTGDVFDVAMQRRCFPSWNDGVIDDYRCYGAIASTQGGCMVGASGSCDGDIFAEAIGFCTAPTFRRLTKTSCDLFDSVQFPMLASAWVGTGRIRLAVTHAFDDARALFVNPGLFQTYGRYMRGPFFDTERQMTCEPTVLDDGSVRCLTQNVATTNLYSDATCTNLIAEQIGGTDPCPTHPPPPGNEFVVNKGRLYKLGSRVYREQVYTMNLSGTGCEVLDVGPVFAYDLVAADASMFALLKIEIE